MVFPSLTAHRQEADVSFMMRETGLSRSAYLEANITLRQREHHFAPAQCAHVQRGHFRPEKHGFRRRTTNDLPIVP